jgi:hypothetical protein
MSGCFQMGDFGAANQFLELDGFSFHEFPFEAQ